MIAKFANLGEKMKRFDLRHLQSDFLARMGEILGAYGANERENELQNALNIGEVGIFLFQTNKARNEDSIESNIIESEKNSELNAVRNACELAQKSGYLILNSLRFNERDWTIILRRQK